MTQQIEQSREKLNRVADRAREPGGQRELEELRKLIRDREDDIQRIDNDTAAVRSTVETTEGETGALRGARGQGGRDQREGEPARVRPRSEGRGRDTIVKRHPRSSIAATR